MFSIADFALHPERLAELAPHRRAPARATLYQPFIVQAAHGPADRDARDTEKLRELLLGRQRLADRVAAAGDAVGQDQIDLVMERRSEIAIDRYPVHALPPESCTVCR